jgi:hypothetical protein
MIPDMWPAWAKPRCPKCGKQFKAGLRPNEYVHTCGATFTLTKADAWKLRWVPEVGWKWGKWTVGFWRDMENCTRFGIDVLPLEVVWRSNGYRR